MRANDRGFRVIRAGTPHPVWAAFVAPNTPALGRALWDAKDGEDLIVELGDGKTPGPLERARDEIRALPER